MALHIYNEFQFAKQITRRFIYIAVFIAITVAGWMGIMLSNASALDGTSFITTWKTDNPGTSNSSSITIPTNRWDGVYNYDVDWDNDGTFDQFGITGDVTHDYGTPGTYTIRIQGQFPQIYFAAGIDYNKIINIDQWGTNAWSSMESSFFMAYNLTLSATDTPDLSGVSSMAYMFNSAGSLDGDLSNWDVSSVTNMYGVFSGADSFNGDISTWNVSNVTDMQSMFSVSSSFNGDLSNWNVSNVTNMQSMFWGADSFNGDISTWNVSNVTDMTDMFSYSSISVQNYDAMLESWAAQPVQLGVNFSGDSSLQYCYAEAARTTLIENKGWTIVDGGNCSDITVSNVYTSTVFMDGTETVVNISGSHFMDGTTVKFGEQQVAIEVLGPTQISATVPTASMIGATADMTVDVTVTNPGGFSAVFTGFNYLVAGLYIKEVWPTTVVVDGEDHYVEMYGRGFEAGATATIDGHEFEVYAIGDTWMTIIVPTAGITESRTVDITVTNPGGETITQGVAFTYHVKTPVIEGVRQNTIVADGSDKYVEMYGQDFVVGATVTVGGQEVEVDSLADDTIGVIVPTAGVTQVRTVDITVTNPNGKSFTLPNALTYHIPQPNTVSAIEFTEFEGRKIMIATGPEFMTHDTDYDIWSEAQQRSLVSLNGVALPFCADRSGSTAADFVSWGADPALVSDDPPCYYLERYIEEEDDWIMMLTPTRVELLLPSDFDTSAPGTISINGSPEFAFNQPAPTIGGDTLSGTPTIDKRPTFQGNTVPGSEVTVTVNSDPIICTTTADSNGNWSCTLPSDIPSGAHRVTVAVETPDGQIINFGPYDVIVDGAGATITDNTPLAPNTGVRMIQEIAKTQGAWPFVTIGTLLALSIACTVLAIRRTSSVR